MGHLQEDLQEGRVHHPAAAEDVGGASGPHELSGDSLQEGKRPRKPDGSQNAQGLKVMHSVYQDMMVKIILF